MFLAHTGFDPDDAFQQTTRKIMNGGWRNGVFRAFTSILDETAAAHVGRG